MPTTKKTSKKTSKKVSKKSNVSKKEKKLKVFCGITQPIPKGYKLGSMKDCLDMKQVRYYGLKKIDSKLIESVNEKKDSKKDLNDKIAALKGKIHKLKKDIDSSKNTTEKKKLIESFSITRKELIELDQKLKKIK